MSTLLYSRRRIGEICDIRYGSPLPASARKPGPIPVYGSNGVVGWHDETLVHSSAVIIGRKGSAGQVHLTHGPSWPIDTTFFIEPVPGVDVRWLASALRWLDLPKLREGGAVPGINRAAIQRLEVAVPDLPTQTRSADFIEGAVHHVEAGRVAAAIARSALDRLEEAAVSSLFADYTKGSPRVALRAISSTISKGTTPSGGGYARVEQGVPFVRAEDVVDSLDGSRCSTRITDEAHQALARSRLRPGDVLITIAGTLGRVGYVAPSAPALNCNQAVAFVRLDPGVANAEFVAAACRSDPVRSALLAGRAGGAIENLNLQQIGSLTVPLPSMDVQSAFLRDRSSLQRPFGSLASAMLARADAIEALPRSLLAKVFSGGPPI